MLDSRLDKGQPFKLHNTYLPNGRYRVRPDSYREDGSVLLQRWDEGAQDWLSEGRRSQIEVLQLLNNLYNADIGNVCAACNGNGRVVTHPHAFHKQINEPIVVEGNCPACKGTGKRTSVSTLGRDVKKDQPPGSARPVGRPKERITAEPNMDNCPDLTDEQFLDVLSLLLRKTLTLKGISEELEITRRQAYHCVYWLRAVRYLDEEQDEGSRGRLYSITEKGSQFLKKHRKSVKK